MELVVVIALLFFVMLLTAGYRVSWQGQASKIYNDSNHKISNGTGMTVGNVKKVGKGTTDSP